MKTLIEILGKIGCHIEDLSISGLEMSESLAEVLNLMPNLKKISLSTVKCRSKKNTP